MLRWGLIPHWAKEASIASKLINARVETLSEKPSFRDALKARRCLIPASGYYEWKKSDTGKTPYAIRRNDGQPLALAGLWERWNAHETFTIVTTRATGTLAQLHHRMPVMVAPSVFDTWLQPDTPDPLGSLVELDPSLIEAFPISTRVNSVHNDDPSLVEMIKS